MASRSRRSFLLAVLGVLSLFGLSTFAYRWLDDLARRHTGTLLPRIIEELTGAYAGALIILVLLYAWRLYVPARVPSITKRSPPAEHYDLLGSSPTGRV